MAIEFYAYKNINGMIPEGQADQAVLDEMEPGVYKIKATKPNNSDFHRKMMKLIRCGFDIWKPEPVETEYGIAEKNFDVFLDEIVMLAGFYHIVLGTNGKPKRIREEINFNKMEGERREQLYKAVRAKIWDLIQFHQPSHSKSDFENILAQHDSFY